VFLAAGASGHQGPPDAAPVTRRSIESVQEQYQDRWLALPGVVGVGIGAVDGKLVLKILVAQKTRDLVDQLPSEVEGYPVIIEETGEFRALPDRR
jgi:hypothetical protein